MMGVKTFCVAQILLLHPSASSSASRHAALHALQLIENRQTTLMKNGCGAQVVLEAVEIGA